MKRGQPKSTRGGALVEGPLRPEPIVQGRWMVFDLAAETEQLAEEEPWRKIGRNAMTLVKQPDLRIVLCRMRSGTRIEEHTADGRTSIHTLSGRLRLHLGSETVDVPAGHLLMLDRGEPHDVEALEESHFLLTMSWSGK